MIKVLITDWVLGDWDRCHFSPFRQAGSGSLQTDNNAL